MCVRRKIFDNFTASAILAISGTHNPSEMQELIFQAEGGRVEVSRSVQVRQMCVFRCSSMAHVLIPEPQ
jgi:hypothetical protein